MKRAPSGGSVVLAKAVGLLSGGRVPRFTFGSGAETTNFLTMVRFTEWLGLWTFMSVKYSPGTNPMDLAKLGAKVPPDSNEPAQIHFTLYSNVVAERLASGPTSPTANAEPTMVDTTVAARRAILTFFIL